MCHNSELYGESSRNCKTAGNASLLFRRYVITSGIPRSMEEEAIQQSVSRLETEGSMRRNHYVYLIGGRGDRSNALFSKRYISFCDRSRLATAEGCKMCRAYSSSFPLTTLFAHLLDFCCRIEFLTSDMCCVKDDSFARVKGTF
jgi:hypothetical protein